MHRESRILPLDPFGRPLKTAIQLCYAVLHARRTLPV